MSHPNIEFIKANLSCLSDYELKDIDHKIKVATVRAATRVYVGDDGRAEIPNIRLRLDESADRLISKVQQAIEEKYGTIDFRAYLRLHRVIDSAYLRHKDRDKYSVSPRHNMDTVFEFVQYIVSGTYDDTMNSVNNFMTANQIRYDTCEFNVEYMGVRLRLYKNDRLDIRFKTPELAAKMRSVLDSWEQVKRADYQCRSI